ncbi:ATP-binding protein [Clostridium butyricum]
MKYTAGLTNASISKLGISSDFNECISEYIWNGFDAGASEVEINFKENEFGAIECINIKDNGIGIIYEDLPKTFKNVLDSNKKIIKRKNNIHGSKGKGRFSFITFADVAVWNTVYRDGDNNQKYTIKILKSEATEYEVEDKECTSEMLGTEVMLSGIYTLDKEHIFQNKFLSYLKEQFAWFLYLNKKKKYKIIIDGKELDYMESIDQNSSKDFNLNIDGYEFKINFIKWIGRIKEKYYFYFMDSNNTQIYKKYTSFNKNSLEFPHSLYVKSNYFDEFKPLDNESKVLKEQLDLFGNRNQRDKIFKELYNKLIDFLEKQIDEHIKVQAPKQVTQLENEGVFPKFNPNSKYDEMRKEDLKDVLTELYVIQPKLFNCTLEHKKTIVGFLNLLLDSNEREGIINIMDNINCLTPEESK